MTQFTSEWYRARLAQSEPKQATLLPTDAESESELHEMIISWCRRQDPQVAYIHSRMDKRSTCTPGAPDFVLLLPEQRTLFIECKTAAGELSLEQKDFAAKAEMNGHTVYLVRDYLTFLAIVKRL